MVKNQKLWERYPESILRRYDREYCSIKDKVIEKMKNEGLYSRYTNNCDINFQNLVNEARAYGINK